MNKNINDYATKKYYFKQHSPKYETNQYRSTTFISTGTTLICCSVMNCCSGTLYVRKKRYVSNQFRAKPPRAFIGVFVFLTSEAK